MYLFVNNLNSNSYELETNIQINSRNKIYILNVQVTKHRI